MLKKINKPLWTPHKYAHELQPKPLTRQQKTKRVAFLIFSIVFFPVGCGRLAKRGFHRLAGLPIYPAQVIIKKNTHKEVRHRLQAEGYHTHYLKTPDNVRLYARYFSQPKPIEEQKTVIIFPGNGASSFSYDHFHKTFKDLGWNILLFDPRHVGKSQRKLATCKSTIIDGETAYQFAKAQGIRKENILLWGHSLGGGISAAVAANHKKTMHMNDRSFSSLVVTIQLLLARWIGSLSKLLGWEYNTEENFRKIQGKKWVITAKLDQIIRAGSRQGEKIPADKQTSLTTTHTSRYPEKMIAELVKRF